MKLPELAPKIGLVQNPSRYACASFSGACCLLQYLFSPLWVSACPIAILHFAASNASSMLGVCFAAPLHPVRAPSIGAIIRCRPSAVLM